MKIIEGVYTSAKVFTDTIEDYVATQIQQLCDNEAFAGCKMRIMPDVHPGKVGTIGMTVTVGEKILPNVVGIDIGCGITLSKIKKGKMEFQKLDTVIRQNIPTGFQVRKVPHRFYGDVNLSELRCYEHIREEIAALSFGTLGGGNHFIEVDKDNEGSYYVAIHSGSRFLGKEVTEYYLSEGQKYLKREGIELPYEMTYVEGQLRDDYLHDLVVVQEYASFSRLAILDEILKGMKWKVSETFFCEHNYVTAYHGELILRKGAISAKKDETVIIPINMRDGILIGTGKGNADWNYSAPHGSGRIMKRGDVKDNFTVTQFKNEMKGIYSTCIGRDTLDEAPFAYRRLEDIQETILETVDIRNVLKTVYNFKADDSQKR